MAKPEFISRPGLSPYAEIWDYQKSLVEKRARDEIPDTFLFVEHPPTVTRGRGLQRKSASAGEAPRAMPLGPLPANTEYFEIERGGDLTWHGPGQLVIYPIVKLDGKGFGPDHDVTGFLRKLERTVGEWLEGYGLEREARADATGIWVRPAGSSRDFRKIASIGIAVRKWVTYHGIALNLANSLEGFHSISPCGFSPDVMTTLATIASDLKTPVLSLREEVEAGLARIWAGFNEKDSDVKSSFESSDFEASDLDRSDPMATLDFMNLQIRELEMSDLDAFLKAKLEWDGAPGFIFLPRYEDKIPFADYVQLLKDHRNGIRLPENFVPDTCHFAFLSGEIVGRVSLRHTLNDFLFNVGGHVGYGVLPAYRGRGIATQLLKHALTEAKALGITRVLLTCDDGNIASSRTIEKFGGKLENILATEKVRPPTRRYWIDNL